MRKKHVQTVLYFLLFVFILFSVGKASTLIENKERPFSFQNSLTQNNFEQSQKIFRLSHPDGWASAHSSYLAYESDSGKAKESVDVYGFKGKSVKRAFLYSLLVPGTGEFYAGSKIKAGLFFAADVTLWALYFNYHGKGKDKEKQYQAFANEHWTRDDYKQWLWETVYEEKIPYEIVSDTFKYWDDVKAESVYFSHHLPDRNTQQYYEMIGKYEQFSQGWKDYDDVNLTSAYRDFYLDMRRISNDWLNKAKYSAMISIANHILSSFDAALAVKKYNKKGERFSQIHLQMRLTQRDDEIVPRLAMSMRF